MNKRKQVLIIILILILLISNIILGYKYLNSKKELESIKETLKTYQFNEKVINFTKFFIEAVLKAEKEVDFETRLKLENDVRDLKDNEILTQWEKFIGSKTENEAQREVKNLLEILIVKIKPQ